MELEQDTVKAYLREWANSESNPHFAVLIEGGWGSGKTHFIKSVIEEESFTKKQIVYVSMFGVNSINTLETQLFLGTASGISKASYHGLNFFGAVANGVIRFDLNQDGSTDIEGKASAKNFGEHLKKYAGKLNNSVIVIDDLERCRIPMSDLLGTINKLVEHSDARVILIANTEKFVKKNQRKSFTSFKEKIVGQSFKISPNLNIALSEFIASVDDENVKAIFEDRQAQIETLYVKSGYSNLRAVRYFVWFYEKMLNELNVEYRKNQELIESLTEQAFIFFIELKLDLAEETTELNPDSLLDQYSLEDENSRYLYDYTGLIGAENKISPRKEMLKKYQLHEGLNCAITLRQWKSILETGIICNEQFNSEIAQSEEVAGVSDWPSWKRLWHFHDWDFSDEDGQEFEGDLDDVLNGLNKGRYQHPKEFLQVTGLLIWLNELGMEFDITIISETFLCKYIDEHIIKSLTDETYMSLFELPFREGLGISYDGLGYESRDNPKFQSIAKQLQDKIQEWRSNWEVHEASQWLIDLMSNDFNRFLGNLIVVNDSSEQRYLSHPILPKIDQEMFVDAWLNLPRRQERLLVGCFKDRYDYRIELLEEEIEWWRGVQAILNARQAETELKPRAIQIGLLSERIDDVVIKRHQERIHSQETSDI